VNNNGLSDLEKKGKNIFVKTEKKPLTVPVAQPCVCLLLSYRNRAIFSLQVLMKLEKDANSGDREVGRLVYSTQEKHHALDSTMTNFQTIC